MALRHIFLPIALSVLIGLAGVAMAMSRGLDRTAAQIVLCTGTGPVVVYVDDQGQPTRPPHYCPDYSLTLLAALFAEFPLLPGPPARSGGEPERGVSSLIASAIPLRPARAPPNFL
ncbi:hypothetical protein [Ruegeria arenilitoris]|uniref:hypothetical protein n=1 Tax=Ruegeria arenilitoris TaxID=1173585 RepID=UPI0020C2D008|nr:hypothetical protein [Ruegeria arenilitoris]